MVNLAIAFLCAAIICGTLGFGLEGLAAVIFGELFVFFLILFIIILLFGWRIAQWWRR